MKQLLIRFFKLEAAVGILLIIATLLALLANNSPLSYCYNYFLNITITMGVQDFLIQKPLSLWVNDGLMAVFFLLIGLEVKREILKGNLSQPSQVILPSVAALGGMIVPALIYWSVNHNNPAAASGWAIPMATDIAFSLGVLALLGKSVPVTLKLFLMTLAIIDDLGAIIVIAIFYSGSLSIAAFIGAAVCLVVLTALNLFKVKKLWPYLLVGALLWVFVLKSGVHATIAGVLLAFTIPLEISNEDTNTVYSPATTLEHGLATFVGFIILPLFAFINAGISFADITQEHLFSSVTFGIAFGLLFGKAIGVFGFSWLIIKSGIAKLPEGSNWSLLFGVAILCGIGFTMSLFIGSLSFPHGSEFEGIDRVGIMLGSLASAVIGYFVMHCMLKKKNAITTSAAVASSS